MRYQLAPLYCRPWTLNGISARLIESHYENNYGAALNRLNVISEDIEQLDPGKTTDQALVRLKRDQIAALNSTLLHELYFASLGGDGRVVPDAVASAIAKDFGSVDRWRREFVSMANGLAGGSGWVLLSFVPRDGRLINQIVSEHDQNVAGSVPILVLDMYEHAYHLEFGANAGAYVAAFMRNIDWAAVALRYTDAIKVAPPRPLEQPQFADTPSISVEEVSAMLKSGTPVQIIDTRPRHYTTKAQDIMEGAVWRDPERLDDWIDTLSKTEPVITFCVYGFHVGCETAAILRKAGFDARYMAGGHFAWKAIKGPVEAGCNGREETGCAQAEPVDSRKSCTRAHEQPYPVCGHRCKAVAVALAYEEQPEADTETDISRSDDPQIQCANACHFGVMTEQAEPNVGLQRDDQSQSPA